MEQATLALLLDLLCALFHIDHLQSREGVPHERHVATAAGPHTDEKDGNYSSV
jgi:hypothetical protein